jgi:hypothetical protein
MARYQATVESVAALSGVAPVSAGATNGLFGNLTAGANAGYKLRRITLGVRAGASVPTSQQLTVAVVRTTVKGTSTNTNAGNRMDPNSNSTSQAALDTAWTAAPTATYAVPYLFEVSFNSQSGVDLPFELLEEWIVPVGTANGLAFFNVANALPASHLYTMALEWEE